MFLIEVCGRLFTILFFTFLVKVFRRWVLWKNSFPSVMFHFSLGEPLIHRSLPDGLGTRATFVSLYPHGLKNQPTFRDDTTGFPAKWRLRNECRNSILMTCHYPDLGSASDWLKICFSKPFLRRFAGKPVEAWRNVRKITSLFFSLFMVILC